MSVKWGGNLRVILDIKRFMLIGFNRMGGRIREYIFISIYLVLYWNIWIGIKNIKWVWNKLLVKIKMYLN